MKFKIVASYGQKISIHPTHGKSYDGFIFLRNRYVMHESTKNISCIGKKNLPINCLSAQITVFGLRDYIDWFIFLRNRYFNYESIQRTNDIFVYWSEICTNQEYIDTYITRSVIAGL